MAAIYKEACSIIEHGVIRSTGDSSTSTPPLVLDGFLCPCDLPRQAFQGTSMTMISQSKSMPLHKTTTLYMEANPFYNTIRQNVKLAHSVGEKIPLLVSDHVFS